jgi:predicted dehydrogenase
MSHPTDRLSRRAFVGSSLAATGGLLALQPRLFAGAAEKAELPPVKLAVMGVNGRGKFLTTLFQGFPNVEIAYLCDPDETVLPAAVKLVTDKGNPAPKVVSDFRRALEDDSVTALICAAPDHWHALATIWACQAGKDVYVEKPCCHNPYEGRKMIEAARKYGRVVQVGSQRRSGTDLAEIAGVIASGELGDVNYARCWINSVRPGIGKEVVTAPPPTLDFNLWAGPGPGNDYKKNLVHYHWHWRWAYGTGECGNNGIHALDVARWGLGVGAPKYVTCGGGVRFFEDDQETPDTQLATFDYDNCTISWEHRTWSDRGIDGENFGVEFYGSKAMLATHGKGWTIYEGKKEVRKREGTALEQPHAENFLKCISTREKPNADIEIAHQSTLLCHLANIAWRTRSALEFDAANETIVGNPAAQALMRREYRKEFEVPSSV